MKIHPRSIVLMALITATGALFLTACVKRPELTDGGKKVQFVENVEIIQDKLDDPKKCSFVANIEVEANVGVGLTESRKKSETKQRMIRARNLAAKNNANVIIAAGELTGKAQKFKAYRCN